VNNSPNTLGAHEGIVALPGGGEVESTRDKAGTGRTQVTPKPRWCLAVLSKMQKQCL
jgi:hypothetical protein